MTKNDQILIDGIVDDRLKLQPSAKERGDVFEYFACEQLLKDFDLSNEQLLTGIVDGRADGGIDGFYILINGHVLQDVEAHPWPIGSADLKFIIITAKHQDTFKQATLEKLIATFSELFDLGKNVTDFIGTYSDALKSARNNFAYAYRRLSPKLAKLSLDIFYVSRGNTQDIGAEVVAKGDQLKALTKSFFTSSDVAFSFIGCAELITLYRQIKNYTLELPFVDYLSRGENYVMLVPLNDYFRFISENGKLRRYLFDSNVRDFMGLNAVNEDIRSTLESDDAPDFWWLNNGVTILASAATVIGKSLQASDVQIINGLQTTESIYRHFNQLEQVSNNEDRCVLVKVMVFKDSAIGDKIIRATNNQTSVEPSSLYATDKVQQDIEAYLLKHNFFYGRRKNFYENLGHPANEIVTPLYIAAGFVALILKLPEKAITMKAKFLRNQKSYEQVFNDQTPLDVWPIIITILRTVDRWLEAIRPTENITDKFLKGWRYIISFCLVSKLLGTFAFTAGDLKKIDISVIDGAAIKLVWDDLNKIIVAPNKGLSKKKVDEALNAFAEKYLITGIEAIISMRGTFLDEVGRYPLSKVAVTEELLTKIREVIPPQPWKKGAHQTVISALGCTSSEYHSAVDALIEAGELYRQKDGVLFNLNGDVVAFDNDRVDPKTLQLVQ